jgi:fluoride exporter
MDGVTMELKRYLWISLGAVLGANARYLVALWAGARLGAGYPYGTLIVNVTGSFVLGFLVAGAAGRLNLAPELRLFLAVGFLGAYTTFSSLVVETWTLLQNGLLWQGFINLFTNNVIGLFSAWLGAALARLISG